MKTRYVVMLAMLAIAGGCSAVAAEGGESRNLEKRVVISSTAASGGRDAEARTPVTFLGVAVAPADPALAAQLQLPEGHGLVVMVVDPDSPAEKAGLQKHDLLTRFDDQILIDPRQLSVLVRGRKEGEQVTVTYLRAGQEARAVATLATHVPGPDRFLQQMRQRMRHDPAEVFFHAAPMSPGAGIELRSDQKRVLPFEFHAPGPGHSESPPGASGDRVMIFRPQAGVVYSDESGTLSMQVDEQGQNLTAKNAEGEVIFTGPVTTPEQRAALPDDLRKRLEKFQSLDVFEAPVRGPGGMRSAPVEWGEPSGPIM